MSRLFASGIRSDSSLTVTPSVIVGGPVTLVAKSPLTLSGTFVDPGPDQWMGQVDYGDGAGLRPLTLRADKSFTLKHAYATSGSYLVKVRVTDDEGAAGERSFVVSVQPPLVIVTKVCTTDQKGRVTRVVVSVSGALTQPGVTTSTNYQLITGGRAPRLVALRPISYSPTARTITLVPASTVTLNQLPRLSIRAARVRDSLGRSFDGDADGRSGGDFKLDLKRGCVTITPKRLS